MAWRGDYVGKDAFVYLELDHRKLAALLRKLGHESHATHERIVEELSGALLFHIDLVERVLYPVLQQGGEIHDRVVEGYSEHQILRLLVNELALMQVGSEEWSAKVGALAENMRQYAATQSALLGTARKTISVATVRQMTDLMQARLNGTHINRPFIAHRA